MRKSMVEDKFELYGDDQADQEFKDILEGEPDIAESHDEYEIDEDE